MDNAILFKALQRHLRFRNPDALTQLNPDQIKNISSEELASAEKYIINLNKIGISFTYPGDVYYPQNFYSMLEPPLFLEYIGEPVWLKYQILSIVGARKIHTWTERWLQSEIPLFLQAQPLIAIASGGAVGVDQCSHWAAIKSERPTIVILPCGVNNLFPANLNQMKKYVLQSGGCFLSEFENDQAVRKHLFFFRNRLITALASVTMVAQASVRSGTFLTVHHALANGRTMVTLPAHPMMTDFTGNHHLMKEGCFYVLTNKDLLNFWEAESWSGRGLTLDIDRI